MDQASMVSSRLDDGRRFIQRFVADGNSLQAAFWVVEDEGSPALYLATDIVEAEGTTVAYRAVLATLDRLGRSGDLGDEIKVMRPSDPVAKDVLKLMAEEPGQLGKFLGSSRFGRWLVDQVYIYPLTIFTSKRPPQMTTEDVGRELIRLMNRTEGPVRPSGVAMEDGTTFWGVPFGLQVGAGRALLAQFIAEGEATPRVVRLDEIASIE